MAPTLMSIAALLAAAVLLMLGNGLFSTLLAVRAGIEGYSTEMTGVIMAAYFAGLVVGVFWCRGAIRDVGHIRSFAAFAAIMSILPLGHAFLVHPWAWVVFRGLAGLCIAGLFMVTESWINERASNEMRGRILAVYLTAYYAALASGQFLLNVGDPRALALFALVSILVSLAIVPVCLTRSEAPPPVPKIGFGIRDLYRLSPLGVAGCAAAGMINAAFYGMGPVFARDIGLPLSGVSWLMGATIIGGLAIQWPIGKLSDYFDRRHVIMGIAVAVVAASAGMAVGADGPPFRLYLIAACYGGGAFALYSVCIAHANDFLSPEQRVDAAGGLLIVYGVGAASGPIVAAAVMGWLGPRGLYLTAGAIQLALLVFAIHRSFTRRTIIRALRRPLVLFPRSSPVITELAQTEPVGEELAGDDHGEAQRT